MRMTAVLTLTQAAELISIIADQLKIADAEPSEYKRIDVSVFDDEPMVNVASFMQVYGKNLSVSFTELVDD